MQRRQILKLCSGVAVLPLLSAYAAAAKIVIIGGGFGGLFAARTLRQYLPAAKITLVEQQHYYYSAPYSHFVLIGARPPNSLRYAYDAAAENIDIVHATAETIENNQVHLAEGRKLPFDCAIVSPGIEFDYSGMSGMNDADNQNNATTRQQIPHAYRGGKQVQQLAQQLQAMPDNGVFIIIPPPTPYRCSPAPYERAALVAHYMEQHKPRGKVLILDPKEQFAQQTLFSDWWNSYYRQRIEWLSGEGGGRVEHIDAATKTVHTEFGEEYGDVINYIPPQRAATIAQHAGLTDSSGWCPVNPATMESQQQKGIYIIGDAAALAPAPKSASCAMSAAAVAAAAVARVLSGREIPLPDILQSICFSHITPNIAFSEQGSYFITPTLRREQVNLTPRHTAKETLQNIAATGRVWHQQTTAALFE